MGKSVSWDGSSRTVSLTGSLVTDADSFENGGTAQGQPANPSQNQNTGLISAETAKSKALAHAGLSSSQVTFIRAQLEWDDGRQVYDVEFYTPSYTEYDYEIDAKTGAIISFDYDAEHYTPSSGNTGSYIGLDRAKEIALAKVPGASAANIVKAKQDWDDGRLEYEIEIIYNSMEYEFEIDGSTGNIISWDSESIYD